MLVTAKQASKMLPLLWSPGLLFTAIMTSTLNRTVKGQVMLLMTIVTIQPTSFETSCVSPYTVVRFGNWPVMFVELEPVRLAILRSVKKVEHVSLAFAFTFSLISCLPFQFIVFRFQFACLFQFNGVLMTPCPRYEF